MTHQSHDKCTIAAKLQTSMLPKTQQANSPPVEAPRDGKEIESLEMDMMLDEAFPASDPPSWSGAVSRVPTTPAPCYTTDPMLWRIRTEFLEMPGLCLTIDQAQRMWSLERRMCEALLRALTDSKFLCRTDAGLFVLRAAKV
jgi:hypothetical protein